MTTAALPLRIVHVAEASGAGVGRHLIDLLGEQTREGHHVTLIYSPLRAEVRFIAELQEICTLKLMTLPMRHDVGLHDLETAQKLASLLRAEGPFDILHAHSAKAGGLVRLISRRIPGRRLYTSHAFITMDPELSGAKRAVYAAIEKNLGNWRTDAIITGSEQEKAHALSLGIAAQKIHLIPMGIAPCKLSSRPEVRQELNLPQDARVIGFVGRLAHQKAPERAIRAFAALADPQAHLVMVGDGPLREELLALADTLAMADHVHFPGTRNGQATMPGFDLLLMPSRYESFGYVFLEACMAGLPIVATPVGIAEEVVALTGKGRIIPNTDDTAPLTAALRDVLAEVAPEVTAGTPAQLDTTFTAAEMARRTLALYRVTLPPHSGP